MNKNNYVLFHCHHLSSLSQIIVLRYLRHPHDQSVLLVNHARFGYTTFAQKIEEHKIFDRVLTILEPKNFDEKQNEPFVCDYYDDYFRGNALSFDDIKEIYTACDLNNFFTIYCRINEKPLSFIEMYAGQFKEDSRYDACTEIFHYPSWLEELSRKYRALTGDDTKYTKNRFIWPASDIQYEEKDRKVDFLNAFYALEESVRERLVSCIKMPEGVDAGSINLLLLNSLKWIQHMAGLRSSQYYLPYCLILDYFYRGMENVVIKVHPSDTDTAFFEENQEVGFNCIPAIIPIEFYGLLNHFHIKRVISVSSSGAAKITRFVEQEIRLGVEFLHRYSEIHKTIVSLLIGTHIDPDAEYRTTGLELLFAQQLRTHAVPLFCDINNISSVSSRLTCLIIKNAEKSDLSELIISRKAILFFLDEGSLQYISEIHPFFRKENMITFTIKKVKRRENTLSDQEDEKIWIICCDAEIRKKMQNYIFEYELPYTGIRIAAGMEREELNL